MNRESRKAGIPAHLNQDLSTNLISDGMVHGLPVEICYRMTRIINDQQGSGSIRYSYPEIKTMSIHELANELMSFLRKNPQTKKNSELFVAIERDYRDTGLE